MPMAEMADFMAYCTEAFYCLLLLNVNSIVLVPM